MTAGSCSIIRRYYATFEGTALAREGYHHWRDWADYLGLPEGADLARVRQTDCLVIKTEVNDQMVKHIRCSAELGIPFEEWSAEEVQVRLPIFALDSSAPARRLEDPEFGKPNAGRMGGAVFWPNGGYVTDPALSTQNLMDAARLHGASLRNRAEVVEILQSGGRVAGVRLASGEEIHAPVVINVAEPGKATLDLSRRGKARAGASGGSILDQKEAGMLFLLSGFKYSLRLCG